MNPCIEHCYLRYRKQYSHECDSECDFAKAVLENKELKNSMPDAIMNMSATEREQFMSLRQEVASYIREYLKEDCGHKSYEGTWGLSVSFPNYFEDETAAASPNLCEITLDCYVLGPARHYSWYGQTWTEAFDKCKSDIDNWIGEGFDN